MLGTGSTQVIEDLLGYAKETAHEKIIRGIALGIAMVMYGRLEEADELIDRLIVVRFPWLCFYLGDSPSRFYSQRIFEKADAFELLFHLYD